MKKVISLFLSFILIFSVCLTVNADNSKYLYFDAVGGTISVDKLLYSESDFVISGFPTPEKTGYNFDGWYTDENYSGNSVTFVNVGNSMPEVLYAKWTPVSVEINYDYGIASAVSGKIINENLNIAYYGQAVNIVDAECDGFEFIGWYLDASYTKKVTELIIDDCKGIKLYAKWKMKIYSVKYNIECEGIDFTDCVVENDNPLSRNASESIILSPPVFDGNKYSFIGWYSDKDYKNLVTEIKAYDCNDYELYALWNRNEYSIEYVLTDREYDIDSSLVNNPNDETGNSTTDFILKNCSYYNRLFTFEGWYLDKQRTQKVESIKAGTNEKITLYAKWCEPKFKIEYDYGFSTDKINVVNDNIDSYEIGTVYTFKPCTVDGFIFNGWFTDEELKTPITEIFENTTGDLKLYASLTEKTYSVRYDMIPVDADVKDFEVYSNNPALRTVSQGITLNDPTTFNVFYSFDGWYSDSEYKNKITEIPEYTVGSITVYAKWVKIISYVPIWGDATLSNGLTVSDARLILKSTARLVELDEISKSVSDINNDGNVNTKDARLILRLVAKLETIDLLTQKYNLKTISVEDGKIVFV